MTLFLLQTSCVFETGGNDYDDSVYTKLVFQTGGAVK
jgi:hypothetical protein